MAAYDYMTGYGSGYGSGYGQTRRTDSTVNSGLGGVPDFGFNYGGAINNTPTLSNRGSDAIANYYNSGAYRVNARTGFDSPTVTNLMRNAESQGLNTGNQAAASILARSGSRGEGRAEMARILGRATGYNTGQQLGNEERWRLTSLDESNAARQLGAAQALMGADLSTFNAGLASQQQQQSLARDWRETLLSRAGIDLQNKQLGQTQQQIDMKANQEAQRNRWLSEYQKLAGQYSGMNRIGSVNWGAEGNGDSLKNRLNVLSQLLGIQGVAPITGTINSGSSTLL